MGHGGGADLSSLSPLLEHALADVSPDIPAQVNADGVDPPGRVEQRCHVVVVLDLRRALVPFAAEGFCVRGSGIRG